LANKGYMAIRWMADEFIRTILVKLLPKRQGLRRVPKRRPDWNFNQKDQS